MGYGICYALGSILGKRVGKVLLTIESTPVLPTLLSWKFDFRMDESGRSFTCSTKFENAWSLKVLTLLLAVHNGTTYQYRLQ
jgi:hypothetical protein